MLLGWVVLSLALAGARAALVLTVQPAGNSGFDVYADGVLAAPIRLAANGAIVAGQVQTNASGIVLSGLRAKDPQAVSFAPGDFVSVTLPGANAPNVPAVWEPVVQFRLTVQTFNTNRWLGLFPSGPAPFHFLICSMPGAKVWHQLGWLNATPLADPFPLLQDAHDGSPELSCLWNRNWSYICPVGGHPIPMIGLWDPAASLYVGYDFQGARVADGSERYVATTYCWQQDTSANFVTLAYPYGGVRFGQQAYPAGGEVLASWFNLEIDNQLPDTEDPNERFQERLFARYTNSLPAVPALNDLGWIPGYAHSADFPQAPGLTLYSSGDGPPYRPTNSVVLRGWTGHREMPVESAVDHGNWGAIAGARAQLDTLLTNYGKVFTAGGETCLYWDKPLVGSWNANWGGGAVTTLHNSEGWYAARVLVELYRYDLRQGIRDTNYLQAIERALQLGQAFRLEPE